MATVSGVLNNRADCYVAESTRQRVLETARKLRYRPSVAARALMGKRTGTLGMAVPGFDVEMSVRKFVGFEAAARRQQQMTITACTGEHSATEDQALDWLIDRYVDGIAVYPTPQGNHDELRRLVEEGFPLVTFDGTLELDFTCDDVSVDSYAGGRLQAQHLLEIGRRRILVVNGLPLARLTAEKIRGVDAVLTEAGLPPAQRTNLSLTTFGSNHWDTHELEQLAQFFRQRAGDFDAIAAVGDMLAMTAIRILVEQGWRVPEDIAVIGYDGLTLSGQNAIPLTTVCHPSEQIGEKAFKLLGRRLEAREAGEQVEPQRIEVPPELIPRTSTVGRREGTPAAP